MRQRRQIYLIYVTNIGKKMTKQNSRCEIPGEEILNHKIVEQSL